jgi:hypothetical protein
VVHSYSLNTTEAEARAALEPTEFGNKVRPFFKNKSKKQRIETSGTTKKKKQGKNLQS